MHLLVIILDVSASTTAHRSVVDVFALIKRSCRHSCVYCPTDEAVPPTRMVHAMWESLVQEKDKNSRTRINQVNKEVVDQPHSTHRPTRTK